eukprot:314040_1
MQFFFIVRSFMRAKRTFLLLLSNICSSRPHGNYIFISSLLTTIAFILSSSSHHKCNFVTRKVGTQGTEGDVTAAAINIGLWAFEDANYDSLCFYYPSSIEFDQYFRAARGMAPLASVIGGMVMIAFWFSSCLGMSVGIWRFCSVMLALASLCEGLTLLIFKSDFCVSTANSTFECELSTGSRMAIASTVFYFVAALSACCTTAPRGFPETYMTTVRTETVLPDGTRVIETRAVPECFDN